MSFACWLLMIKVSKPSQCKLCFYHHCENSANKTWFSMLCFNEVRVSNFQRSCVLFLLGVMLNTVVAGPRLHTMRVFGVLQRFGITYFVVSMLVILLSPRNSSRSQVKYVFFYVCMFRCPWSFVENQTANCYMQTSDLSQCITDTYTLLN